MPGRRSMVQSQGRCRGRDVALVLLSTSFRLAQQGGIPGQSGEELYGAGKGNADETVGNKSRDCGKQR